MQRRGHQARAPLGVNERNNRQHHACGYCQHLQLTDVAAWDDLSDEEVIHVGQRVEGQREEEECAPLLSVSGIVVPEDQSGQSSQDDHAQEVVQRRSAEQERQQHQGWDHGDLQVVYHGPENRRLAPAGGRFVFEPPTDDSGHQ